MLFELHGFSDASFQVYSAVVYFRTVYTSGAISSTIISSKTTCSSSKDSDNPQIGVVDCTNTCQTSINCEEITQVSVNINLSLLDQFRRGAMLDQIS